MELVSKSAQVILDGEIAEYRNRILKRATLYMNQDGETLIHDKQIKTAIRDLASSEMEGQWYRALKRKRRRSFLLSMYSILLFLMAWLMISVIYLENGTYDKKVFIVGIIGSLVSMTALTLSLYKMKTRRRRVRSENIDYFLSEWNEFESLLRYAYKSSNKGEGSFGDLLMFYLNSYSEDKDTDERRIINALRIRTNILHRGIDQVNESVLLRHTAELQDLIRKMKH